MGNTKVTGSDFGDKYSDKRFWTKAKNHAKIAGKKVLKPALTLYYTMHDKETPKWAKGIIIGSLAYFIWPADAIPDIIPALGYTDDLGVLTAAIASVAVSIKPEHNKLATEKLKQWFN